MAIKQFLNLRSSIFAGYLVILCCLQSSALEPIDGTTGAPLGGIGAGAIKFKAHDGTFAQAFWSPCANNSSFQAMAGTRFQFFSLRSGSAAVTSDKLSAVITNNRAEDDAVYPVHYANFGTINNISVNLTAFSPVNQTAVDQMCYPYAFFEIKLTNTAATAVDAAVAFITTAPDAFTYVADRGIWSAQRTIFAASDDPLAVKSAGNDAGFMTSGVCNNTVSGSTNKVAVKVSLAANQTRYIKFIFCWFNTGEPARYFYSNVASSSRAFGDTGLVHFDELKANATGLVTRMRASNLPDWLKNQALVSLCNLTNNSMYTQDRRYAHTEGMWNTNGTMDQMWHARQIYAQIVPSLNWQELYYWGATQKTNPVGQIHHDLGGYGYGMCTWTDRQHADYRPIDSWVDLNCAFIVSVYEAYIASDDQTRLDSLWDEVVLAGQRIRTQVAQMGNTTYPGTFQGSQNSYDAGGNPDPFNSSIVLPAYKILSWLAGVKNDAAMQKTYDSLFTLSADSFKKRFLTNNFPSGRISESVMGGQWLGYFLKFGEFFPQTNIDYALTSLDAYYHPLANGLGFTGGTYDEWAPYFVSHYGGLLQQTNHNAEWRKVQFDWANRWLNDRNKVYNVPLSIPPQVTSPNYRASSITGFDQYISAPVVWRMYYDLIGFHRNKHSNELWLEPILPAEINHTMTDAYYFAAEGNGTISCTESGTNFVNQSIFLKPDKTMQISALYLKDRGIASPHVFVNGVEKTFTRIGSGYAKELKVDLNISIPPTGIQVDVTDQASVLVLPSKTSSSSALKLFCIGSAIEVIADNAGWKLDVMTMSGKRIAQLAGYGRQVVAFNTAAKSGTIKLTSGTYVARLAIHDATITRSFYVGL